MKKILAVITFFSIILGFTVYAEEENFTSVGIHLYCTEEIPLVKSQTLTFDLRDKDTNIILDTKSVNVSSSNYRQFDLSFNVPEYEIGKSFILHMSKGNAELEYNGTRGAYFTVQTYSYPNSDYTAAEYTTDFYFGFSPAKERVVNLYLDGEKRPDLALFTYPDGILISAKALSSLGISSSVSADGGILISRSKTSLLLYPNQICAYKNGAAFNLSLEPMMINGKPYVPVGDTVALFGCKTEYSDDGCTLNLSIGYSSVGRTRDEEKLISLGKKSDTNYLIWVSKSEYTVRIYKGGEGGWHRINSFPCAIGAPSTPTCEGTYKYYQYQNRWEYPTYYVGPIMRFNGGYAIHSTLLRYNGTNADSRVGVKISHGCVRVRPEGINWMAKNIPLYTTVYITP